MFYNNTYCKSIPTVNNPDNCDIYWDNYRVGTVCYTYNTNNDKAEIVYHRKEISHMPEVLVRKFFAIPSMTDLKRCYKHKRIQDSYALLEDTKD